jgi:protocatechuate 3,4-dioxygenase beta subunit
VAVPAEGELQNANEPLEGNGIKSKSDLPPLDEGESIMTAQAGTGAVVLMMDALIGDVTDRLAATPDPRLREVMQALVRHLHAFAREVRLTEAEWLAGMNFLAQTGHRCDEVRQEFILLSDTLGLSSLVDLLNHGSDDPRATAPTILGPFYVPQSPWREYGASMVEHDDQGQPAVLRGRVLSTGGDPVSGAVVDVWLAASTGLYAVQQPDVQGRDNLRGRYRTNDDGRFEIRTVRPVPYPIPNDGPVGQLLAATGRHPMRAAHIHAIVTAEGYRSLITQIFDAADDYLDSDTVFGVKGSLVRDFVRDGAGVVCETDFVLEPNG